jgi:Spy/CpxP family protein refolding chaperone
MRKFHLIAVAAALLFTSTGFLLAQVPSQNPLVRFIVERQQAAASFLNSLNLTPAQQAQARALQQASRQTQADALLAAAATAEQVKRDLKNPNADLRQTALLVQSTVDMQLASHRALTAQRLSFYETLNPTQKAQVREQLVQRIERLERVRDLLLELSNDGA